METDWLRIAKLNERVRRATTPRLNKYIPHKPTPKQAAFLLLDCRDAMYGGAAGGGKSDALLMAALQYVDLPDYAALLIRATYKDLTKPDALMDRAHQWLHSTDAIWHDQIKTWEFPSGSRLVFGYLDGPNDHYQYQGAAFQFIGIDEASQIRMNQIQYLFSRLRRAEGSDIPLRFRVASNPGGRSHAEIKKRYIDPRTRGDRVFIPARLEDNPHLDEDEYRRSLAELDPVTRAQLEHGDWEIRADARFFQRQWLRLVSEVPADLDVVVRAWDVAATEPHKANKDPDWTVGVKMGYHAESGTFYVMDVVRTRSRPGEVARLMRQTAQLDGHCVLIVEEQEGGSSGKTVVEQRAKMLAGYVYRGVPSTGSKAVRAAPFASQAEAGNVCVLAREWTAEYLDELELFPDGAHDDQVDATSLAFLQITEKLESEDYDGSGAFDVSAIGELSDRNVWSI